MNKISLLLLLFFGTISASFSQKKDKTQNYTDIITLKNKTSINGKIIERIDSVSIKIETSKSSVIVIPWSEIKSISVEDSLLLERKRIQKLNKELADVLDKGFSGEFDLGFQYLNHSMISTHISMGYQFNPHFVLRGGFGVESPIVGLQLPLFIDLKYNFLVRKGTPFVFLRPGCSFAFVKESYTSTVYNATLPYLNVGVGYQHKFARHFGLSVKAGYRMQYSTYNYGITNHYEYNFLDTKINSVTYAPGVSHGFNIMFGIEF